MNKSFTNLLTYCLTAGFMVCTAFTASAQPPVVSTGSVSNLTYQSAQLNGYVTVGAHPATVSFEWGTTTSYGNTVAGTPGTNQPGTATSFSAALPSLTSSTTYHYRAVATSSDTTVKGQDVAFTTQVLAAPYIFGVAIVHGPGDLFAAFYADIITNNSATSATVEYGTTTALGQTVAATPASIPAGAYGSFSCSISGLVPHMTYFYHWVMRNGIGTTTSAMASFNTFGLAVGSVNSEDIQIYPNPATDHLTIDLPEGSGNTMIHVTDVTGKLVPVPAAKLGRQYQLNLSALAYGAYNVSVSANGHTYSQVVIKK